MKNLKKRQLNALFGVICDSEVGECFLKTMFGGFYAGHSVFKVETYSVDSHKELIADREKLADMLRQLADAIDDNAPVLDKDEE